MARLTIFFCFVFCNTLLFIFRTSIWIQIYNYSESIDKYTRCLLDMHEALDSLSIPWFLTFGTALVYWRSKNFVSDDMDIGIFYDDLKLRIVNDEAFARTMIETFHFDLRHHYGKLDHGREWSFSCPISKIPIDIFVFYPLIESNQSSAYWTATYNGLCNRTLYKKCRWKFRRFNLTTFKIYKRQFRIVPLEFIEERYGKNYMIPTKYNYFESLEFLPNLIEEYDNKTNEIEHHMKRKKRIR